MAIDVCSEISSTGISPRISFSHDLKNQDDRDTVEARHRCPDLCLLDSSPDFVFSITTGLSLNFSSADELFSNGRIVPMEIKKAPLSPTNKIYQGFHSNSPFSQASSTGCTGKKMLKEFLSAHEEEEEDEERPSTKSFWQFSRSSSLNCDATRGRSLIRPLQFLSRSNSTGSVPNPKQTELQKETQKQRLQKQCSVSSRRSSSSRSSSSSSSSSTYYFYNSSQKQKKTCGSSGNGVRISPVLNLPQAHIPKATVSFLRFGSLFCNGRNKRKKK
ncbi:hypothetical protein L6164_026850 [Bauhinia variegata]|uniref:Uncharacterized protein n=1 Tax=Bauhinia variegata TaxID=167791 RepID=A0ACB9LR15_BAUVA|nr:hypothetical protein L6164_026850 [Bauhinia variegata]